MITKYKPSGRFSFFTTLIGFSLIAFLILPVLSYGYSWAIWNIPLIYIRFLVTIIYASFIGVSCSTLIKYGKIRNGFIAYFISFSIVAISMILHWASWINLLAIDYNIQLPEVFKINPVLDSFLNVFSTAFYPEELLNTIKIVINNGVWKIKQTPIQGATYWLVAILEFLLVAFIVFRSIRKKYRVPFCEISNQWMQQIILGKFELFKRPDGILEFIETGKISCLNDIKRTTKENHAVFTIFYSDYNNYLCAKNLFKTSKDSFSIEDFEELVIVDNVKIDQTYIKSLIDHLKGLKIAKQDTKDTKDLEESITQSIPNPPVLEKPEEKKVIHKQEEDIKKIVAETVHAKEPRQTSRFNKILIGFVLTAVILGGYYVYNQIDSKVNNQDTDYSNTIRRLLEAEEARDFNKVKPFYDTHLKRYWTLQEPTFGDLEKQYTKSWNATSYSKNNIISIEKETDSTYILMTVFEYVTSKNKTKKSVTSKVFFKFEKNGLISEIYGLN